LTYQRFSLDFNNGSVGKYNVVQQGAPLYSQIHLPLAQPQTPAGVFDYDVEWTGVPNTTIWLDDIRIDGAQSTDQYGYYIPDYYNGPWVCNGSFCDWPRRYRGPNFTDSLFNGYFDSTLKHNANSYINKPRLQRFYFTDEPWLNQYMSVRYVNNVLTTLGASTSTGKGLGHQAIEETTGISAIDIPYNRYSIEAKPFEIATDPYRFHYLEPKPGDGGYTISTQVGNGTETSGLQTQITKFKAAQQNAINTYSHNWWFYPNVGLYADSSDHLVNREPTLNEIKVQVNLALAYGAKGVMYFNFWSEAGYDSTFLPNGLGVLGLINTDMTPITYNRYAENKWAGVKAINQTLAGPLGSTLMKLLWQSGFSIDSLNGGSTGTYITYVTTLDAAYQGQVFFVCKIVGGHAALRYEMKCESFTSGHMRDRICLS